jgi:transketolase
VLLVSGGMLPKAVEVANILKKYKISLGVYSVPTIKPINRKQLKSLLQKYSNVFTLEEHSVVGGLGSAIAEFIVDNHIHTVKFHRFGTPDQFIYVTGSRDYLLQQSGLSASFLVEQIIHT